MNRKELLALKEEIVGKKEVAGLNKENDGKKTNRDEITERVLKSQGKEIVPLLDHLRKYQNKVRYLVLSRLAVKDLIKETENWKTVSQ
jgi:hypothetical protein